jgi:acyl-CoA thioester hydrolase
VIEPYRHRLRVRYRECDAQGHAFFTSYPEWLDVGITELFRERVGGWNAMVEGGHDLVVGELTVQYRGSAQFDELIDVVLDVQRVGETSLTTAWSVERSGEQLVTGTVRHVCIDPETHAKKAVPDHMRAAFA